MSNAKKMESSMTLASGVRQATPMTAQKHANQKGKRTDCNKERGVRREELGVDIYDTANGMKMPFLLTTETTEVSRSHVANLRVLRAFSVNSVVKNTTKTTNLFPLQYNNGEKMMFSEKVLCVPLRPLRLKKLPQRRKERKGAIRPHLLYRTP